MIDFLALLLINMVAGFVLLAGFVYTGLNDPARRRWAPGFIMVGLIALIFGGDITMRWLLPGSFNIAYGEMSVLYGVIFLIAGITLAFERDLLSVTIYAFFAGLAAIVVGIGLYAYGMLPKDRVLLPVVGFVLSGLAGVCSGPMLVWFKNIKSARLAAVLVLLATAAIWALIGYMAYWGHLEAFKAYKPH